MLPTKNKLFLTYYVLKQYSNKENPMNATEVAKKVQEVFELEKAPNRRTIYDHFEDLELISEVYEQIISFRLVRMPNREVYIESTISSGEVHLLSDAVATSRFIDLEQSRSLIQKLGIIVGQNLKNFFEPRLHFKATDKKEYNEQLFQNIDVLTEAIKKGKKVTLQYLKYDVNKQLVPSRPDENNGYKKIRPYYLIWQINKYYLMYYYDDSTSPRFMRVDKMRDVTMIDEAVGELKDIPNLSDYTRNQAYMFGGMPEYIRFRCKMYSIGQVIDFFGEDVTIKPIDEEYFQVEVYTSCESIKFWLMQYISSIDQIEPLKLAVEIEEMLEDGLRRNRVKQKETFL
ncbi:WYL domain-containing protein [Kurthia sp. FSL E2-0154]|uniref:helix-turn-helix transcriptional regulator n=1 Tax=Kurthia sp. FSL E2-0154 TaxID=2921358 RepID=UPI0030F9A0CA